MFSSRFFINSLKRTPILPLARRHASYSTANRLRMHQIANNVGIGLFSCMLGFTGWLIKEALVPRETEVLAKARKKSDDRKNSIMHSDQFSYKSSKPKGDLSGAIVIDNETGLEYMQKGAKHKDALIKEYVLASFLAYIRPDCQPKSAILEDPRENGSVRLYTLSEMAPDAIDLEDFILSERWRNTNKPITGLDVAIAADMLLSKTSDTKFANYIVIEREMDFVVACIDHENSKHGWAHGIACLDEISLGMLYRHFVDTNPFGYEHKIGLYDHVDLTTAFLKMAQAHMNLHNVLDFYNAVGGMTNATIYSFVNSINDVLTVEEKQKYINELKEIRHNALIYSLRLDMQLYPGRNIRL